jgi:hypothetical protein
MTTGTEHSPGYIFETTNPAERQRLDAHAQLWDPFTFRKLAETGVGDGWRCEATLRAYDDRDHPTTTFTPILVAASGRRPAEHHVG